MLEKDALVLRINQTRGANAAIARALNISSTAIRNWEKVPAKYRKTVSKLLDASKLKKKSAPKPSATLQMPWPGALIEKEFARLKAQQLKSQYGSVRVREKVDALVQHAQGICSIAGEIICANFDGKTLLEMSLTKMPTDADIKKQITLVQKQATQAVEHLNGQLQVIQQQATMQLPYPQPGAPQPLGVPAQ